MALQFATGAVVRLVTDKVMEAVIRQLAEFQRQAVESAQANGESTIDVTAVVALNAEIRQLSDRITDLSGQTSSLQQRIDDIERRYGWPLMVKIVAAMAATVLVGFGLGWLAQLGGWF